MSPVLKLYNSCSKLPFGKWIYSKLFCFKAPYFGTIKPVFVVLKPGYGEFMLKNRRSVHNHIGSVHAIAMCNLCELAAGVTMEATLPRSMRWIPNGMEVEYLNIAKSDLRTVCEIKDTDLTKKGDVPLNMTIVDMNGTEVVRCTLKIHISPKSR